MWVRSHAVCLLTKFVQPLAPRKLIFAPTILWESRDDLSRRGSKVRQVLSDHVFNAVGLLQPDKIDGANDTFFLLKRYGKRGQAVIVRSAAEEAANH